MHWEDELFENIRDRVSELSETMDEEEIIEVVDAIMIEEAKKLQDKYRTIYNATTAPGGDEVNWIHWLVSKAPGQVNYHEVLKPLYTEFTDKNYKKSLAKVAVDSAVGGMYKASGYIMSESIALMISNRLTSVYKGFKGKGQVAEGVNKTGSLIIEEGGQFSATEIKAAEYMKNLGNNVKLRMPQGTRAGGGTSDLLVNGVNYDVYTPTTNNVNRIIGSMAGKNSQTTGIVLDLSQTTVTAEQLGNALARVKGIIEAGGKTCNINDIIIIK